MPIAVGAFTDCGPRLRTTAQKGAANLPPQCNAQINQTLAHPNTPTDTPHSVVGETSASKEHEGERERQLSSNTMQDTHTTPNTNHNIHDSNTVTTCEVNRDDQQMQTNSSTTRCGVNNDNNVVRPVRREKTTLLGVHKSANRDDVLFEVHHNHILGLTCPTEHDPRPCYPTYTMQLAHVEEVFGDLRSDWCRSHAPARAVFGWGALSMVLRWVVRKHHDRFFKTGDQLYLKSGVEFLQQIHYGRRDGVPRMFTYTLHDDGVLHFSETGQGFFRDKFSKHAIQARATSSVRCAGEFHIQPTNVNESEDEKELTHWVVIDNNSGTYAPEQEHLRKLEKLLHANFPDLRVEVLDHDSDVLKQYKIDMASMFGTERCRIRDDIGSANVPKENTDLHSRAHNLWHSLKHSLPFFTPTLGLGTAFGVTAAAMGAAGLYFIIV